MDFEVSLDPASTREDVAREVRRSLPTARAVLWDKLESDRQEKGITAALSYLRALLEESSQAVRSELDVIHGGVKSGG